MSDYGVTDKGFQMRRLDEIYTDICKRFKDEVGVDPSENPQSVMNVLFTIFADAPAELWEAYAAAYQQLFPNTACGVALDNVMQVGGVSRIGQAKTKYFISCTGQEGTVIPVGALIQSSSRPQRTFQAVSASTRFVIRSGSYMDDLVLFGRRWADIQSAARKLTKWALTELGLTIKNEWVRVDFLSAAEEHQRRHLTGAAKGCPGLDMAGYVMHRTYTTIRPRIFLRARRQYIRAKADVSRNGYVPVWRSYKLVSYNGYFDWTKSRAISEALKQKKLFTAAKVAIRVTAQRNAMKKVRIAA